MKHCITFKTAEICLSVNPLTDIVALSSIPSKKSVETLKYLASSVIYCVDGTDNPISHAFIADRVKPRDLASSGCVIPAIFPLKTLMQTYLPSKISSCGGIMDMARRGENIYKRKDGRWEGCYKNGFRSDGSVRYASVYAKSYIEVKSLLSEKRIANIENSKSCNLTVNTLFLQWFDDIKLKVKESTYANYYMKYTKHILPALGGLQYEELTAENLNNFITSKIKCGLSPKYVSDIAGVIKSVCRYSHCIYRKTD